jgi:hypothetical protein
MPAQAIESEISRIESSLRELKIQYDMFFAGAVPAEPSELHNRLKRMIALCSVSKMQKYQHRFHFNSVVARYNSLAELWGRHIRTMEEGDARMPALKDRVRKRESVIARCQLGEQAIEADLRRLHAEFLRARTNGKAEESGKKIPFKAFSEKIFAQARKLRETHGCDAVELRVVRKDRQILLKAKPAH